MPPIRIQIAWTLFLAAAAAASAAKKPAPPEPAADPTRIVNESYGFRKEREPTMTEVELAMYEKIVPMVTARPAFALTLLEGMVSGEEASPAFEFVLGNVYFEQKRFAEAEMRFKAAIARFPTFLRAWDNLGVVYFTTEQYAKAVPCFTKVLSLGESEPRVFGLLAFCQLKTGNVLAAESSYLQAYSRDPDNSDWIEGLLSTYLDSDQHARAEALLRQLVRLRPGESRFWILLASTLHAQHRRVEAIASLDAARALGVIDTEGLTLLGDMCAEQKLHAEAVHAYRTAGADTPGAGTDRLANLARALIAEEDLDQAARVLDEAAQGAGSNTSGQLEQARAELHLAREEWALAAEKLEALLTHDPLNGKALLDLGGAEEALGRDSRAIIHYEMAVRSEDQAFVANLRLANLQVRLLHFTEALAALDRALAIDRTPHLVEFRARVEAMIPEEP